MNVCSNKYVLWFMAKAWCPLHCYALNIHFCIHLGGVGGGLLGGLIAIPSTASGGVVPTYISVEKS